MIKRFRVFSKEGTEQKIVYFKGRFHTRQKARNFCRNRKYLYDLLIIVHPDGTQEVYDK